MLMTAPEAVGSLRARPTATLSELGDVLTETSRSYRDISVNTHDLSIDHDSGSLTVTTGVTIPHRSVTGAIIKAPRDNTPQQLKLRDTALSQLAAKLKIPASYLRRCPPELLAENINHWLRQDANRELLLRCDGNEARAMLSPRYQRIDNLKLVELLADHFDDATPLRYELTETQLMIQFIDARDPEVASRGDLLHSGISIRNSEVGMSSVEVGGLVYRTICLNGQILNARGEAWRRRHIGNPDLIGELGNAIERAQSQSRKATSTLASTNSVVVPQPLEAIDRVVQHFQLSEAQSEAIKWGFNIEPGERLFNIINSVTRGAQNETLGLDARRELQEVGGRMLSLAESGHSWLK